MNQLNNMQPAFVIKNYIPYSHKVIILHKKLGKITCMFSPNHQAALLTSGSLIWCSVQKTNTIYKFLDLEIESAVCLSQLQFVHDIMRLCLQGVVRDIATPELFDFLSYVHSNIEQLSQQGQMVVMLRLFLMLDLLPEEQEIYRIATLDPYGPISHGTAELASHVAQCFDNFYQQEK